MDRVRLGRALGFGARAAAKTLVQAANAAMSPNPNAAAPSAAKPAPAAAQQTRAVQTPPAQTQVASNPGRRAGNVINATGRMGRAVLEPVKRHSRELWLQVTGGFFVLLACSMAGGMWALRITVRTAFQNVHANHAALWTPNMLKFYVAAAACLMFAYFAVSNFVRAGRISLPRQR